MDAKTKTRFEARAAVMKALGHPARLLIVDWLMRGERCVGELAEMLGGDVSTISRHLSVLKNAGVLSDEKRGNQVYYSLRVPCVVNFFSCVDSVLKSVARERSDLVD